MKKHSISYIANSNRTEQLSKKLLNEIAAYERLLAELKTNGTYINFTMIHTYKELIAARKDMLQRLTTPF
jgi:hypothetical protein